MTAVITGDIINSSKIKGDVLASLMNKVEAFLESRKNAYPDMEFETFRGDSFQIMLPQAERCIELSALMRAFIISLSPGTGLWDVRISVGLGTLDSIDRRVTLSSGTAFVNSGRGLDKMKKRERLVFKSPSKNLDADLNLSASMITIIISSWTLKRAKICLHAMLGHSRDSICGKFNISNTTLSSVLSASNYTEFRKALEWSETQIKNYMVYKYK